MTQLQKKIESMMKAIDEQTKVINNQAAMLREHDARIVASNNAIKRAASVLELLADHLQEVMAPEQEAKFREEAVLLMGKVDVPSTEGTKSIVTK